MGRVVSPPLHEIDRLRPSLTDGELQVLQYFCDVLPADWEIYIQPHLNGLRPDFVLLHPHNGIAVYEVKDWHLSAMEYFVDARAGRVPRLMARKDGKEFSLEKQNPVAKIDAYKEEIYNLYCPSLPTGEGFGSIVAGIILPNASTKEASNLLEPLRDHYQHLGHQKLYPVVGRDLLCDRSKATIKRYVLPSLITRDQRMKGAVADDLRHWLVEPEFTAEQRRPLRDEMTGRQLEIARNDDNVQFRRVRGPAGSGKSLVLASRAATLAMKDRRVLVVTFNITLINYLLDLAVRFAGSGAVRNRIEAMNFHYWCKRVALDSGHIADYEEIWGNNSPAVVLDDLLPKAAAQWVLDIDGEERWSAILVDEGQDFLPAWWSALQAGLRKSDPREMLLCADGKQNVYGIRPWTDLQMTGAGFRGRWLELDTSFRLSPRLCVLAQKFIDDFLPDVDGLPPAAPQGRLEFSTHLEWRQVGKNEIARHCFEAMLGIVRTSKPAIAYSDLVCVVESADIGLEVVRLLREWNVAVIHTFGVGGSDEERRKDSRRKKMVFYKGDARVKVTTLHSFKGWESKAVVVQVSHAASAEALALVYTGLTRMKWDDRGCYLTVVCSATELAEFGAEFSS